MQTLYLSSTLGKLPIALALSSSLLVLACAHDKPAPVMAPEPEPVPLAQVATPAPQPDVGYLVISESVRDKCGLPSANVDEPQFDFDRAELRPRGIGILDGLARCMNEGSLKGQSLTLIGHTDPRGTDDYNLKLGMERADAARDYLTNHGVASSALTVRSRGKQDSVGDGPDMWQLDRRIDIQESSQTAH